MGSGRGFKKDLATGKRGRNILTALAIPQEPNMRGRKNSTKERVSDGGLITATSIWGESYNPSIPTLYKAAIIKRVQKLLISTP